MMLFNRNKIHAVLTFAMDGPDTFRRKSHYFQLTRVMASHKSDGFQRNHIFQLTIV